MQSIPVRGALLATSILAAAGAAHAQTPTAPELETVVVTGSRITRPGYSSPTPVATITPQDIERRAPANISELQADIPQLRPNLNTNGNRTSGGGSSLDLRGLGPLRTLLLVDGRRMPVSNPSGLQDTTALPAILINRIDIVTGGASAAYGSDAVSGVVNILLDNRLDGVKATVQGGQAEAGDYKNYDAAVAWGGKFGADGKGHVIGSLDFYNNDGAQNTGSRDWGRSRAAIITNPLYTAGNTTGQTRLLFVNNVSYSQMTNGGVIVAAAGSPLRGIQFGPNGSTLPFAYGASIGTLFQQGGDGESFADRINMFSQQERKSAYLNVTYDVSESLSFYGNAFYSKQYLSFAVVPNYNNGDITIQRDNAYLPSNVRDIMLANNLATFRMGRTNEDQFLLTSSSNSHSPVFTDVDTRRFLGGAKGKLGDNWSWDAYVQYASNDYDQGINNDRIQANFFNAVDAVISPTTGQAVCRSTLTAPSNGCVPVNLFGPNTVTQQAAAYFLGTSRFFARNKQSIASANIDGTLFELPAGPVSVATGVEFRHEEVRGTPDAISIASGWRTNNYQPLVGEVDVKEAYGEAVVPLLKDLPLARSLELNTAVRVTDYSTSGAVTTWKVGANYEPTDDLRLRGTISHDIRAPNLNELFSGATSGIGLITDPTTNTQVTVKALGGGNPGLDPEVADTYTVGLVYRPSWLPGLQGSIDYYSIEIDGAIGAVGTQQVVSNCAAGQTAFCAGIVRDATTRLITEVFAGNINFQKLTTNGVDFDAVYSFTLGDIAPGRMTLHYNGAYVGDRTTVASGVEINYAGDIRNAVPKWRHNLSALYQTERFTLQAAVRYVGGGILDATYVEGVDINENDVPSRTYLDLSSSYQLRDGVTAFGKIDNVFDKDPPLTPGTAIGMEQAGSNLYDRLGRVYTVGLRFRF